MIEDRLNDTVDAILEGRDASAALSDPELAPLARVAAGLRDYPNPQFKARLRSDLERSATMSSAIISAELRQGFTTITPYLRVSQPGLVDFLDRVFGAEETGSSPLGAGRLRREVRIGSSMIVIDEGGGPDAPSFRPAEFHVYVRDADAAFERAIAAGATSLGEPADRPYGERAGFVRDAFGNHWFIATHRGDSYVPQGLETLTPFLHARNTAQYIDFLKRSFGAVEEGRQEIGGGTVRYARLRIGNAAIELGEAEGPGQAMPGAFYLDVADVDVVYGQAIAAGAKPLTVAAGETHGDRVAGVEDPAGNQWLIVK